MELRIYHFMVDIAYGVFALTVVAPNKDAAIKIVREKCKDDLKYFDVEPLEAQYCQEIAIVEGVALLTACQE